MPNAAGTPDGARRFSTVDTRLALKLNRIQDSASMARARSGIGSRTRNTTAGIIVSAARARITKSATCPLTTRISTDTDGNVKASVTPGTVNQFVAMNMFDTFDIAKEGTFYVKAGVETDGENVTSWSLYVDSSEPDPQTATASSLPTSFDVLIAIIKDSAVYRVLSCGSIVVTPTLAFTVDKDSPAGPGESPTVPYYIWQVSTA